MAADSFTIKIVTPRGPYAEEEVTSVTLPSQDGEVGIFPQHTKYTSLLGIGMLEFHPVGSPARKVVVSRGFCSFAGSKLKILADRIDDAESVLTGPNAAELNAAARKEAEHKLASLSAYEREWRDTKDEIARLDALEALK